MRNGFSNPLNTQETYLKIRAGQYSTNHAHAKEEGTRSNPKNNTVGVCIPRLQELEMLLCTGSTYHSVKAEYYKVRNRGLPFYVGMS